MSVSFVFSYDVDEMNISKSWLLRPCFWIMYAWNISYQVWRTKARVDRCPGCKLIARNVVRTYWKWCQIPRPISSPPYLTTIDTRLCAPHFASHTWQRHHHANAGPWLHGSQDFRVIHLANLVCMDTKSRKCEHHVLAISLQPGRLRTRDFVHRTW